jgi:hypothetical protein
MKEKTKIDIATTIILTLDLLETKIQIEDSYTPDSTYIGTLLVDSLKDLELSDEIIKEIFESCKRNENEINQRTINMLINPDERPYR